MERVDQRQSYSINNQLREACAVFGVEGLDNAADITRQGLEAQQGRGQDSTGIAGYDGNRPNRIAELGLVKEVFPDGSVRGLKGGRFIGQNRYATSGSLSVRNAQPVEVDIGNGKKFYLSHNGTIANTGPLEGLVYRLGIDRDNLSDSGMFGQAIGHFLRRDASLPDAFKEVSPYVPGVFTVVMLTPTEMGAARCEYGVKPGSIGTIGDAIVVASETNALDAVGADYLRDLVPGQLDIFDHNGITPYKFADPKYRLCIFEPIYFANPDSIFYGKKVEDYRVDLGRALARQYAHLSADIVIPLPNSGNLSGKGFTEVSGIPIDPEALIKNPDINRTFITAGMEDRMVKARMKYIPNPDRISGKRVITVDDSQVHGTTDLVTVPMLRAAGAAEVIVLKASPMYAFPNFYGTNTSEYADLAAAGRTVEQIREWIGADFLGFLSLENLKETLGPYRDSFDFSVFNGDYCVDIGERIRDIEQLLTPA